MRTRNLRLAQARAEAEQVRLDLAWSEWQTAGATRIQLVRIMALEQTVRLTEQNRVAARSLLQRNLRAAGRGDLGADALLAARTAAMGAEDKARTSTQDFDALCGTYRRCGCIR